MASNIADLITAVGSSETTLAQVAQDATAKGDTASKLQGQADAAAQAAKDAQTTAQKGLQSLADAAYDLKVKNEALLAVLPQPSQLATPAATPAK